MLASLIQFSGDQFDGSKIGILNKTGAQLVKGGVYALDLSRIDPTSISVRTALANAIGVVAGNIAGILGVAETATNPGESGNLCVFGLTNLLVNGGQASAVNEVQVITINGTTSAGVIGITFIDSTGKEQAPQPWAFNAALATIQAALDAVSGGANQIVATGTVNALTLTFSGNLYAGKPQPLVQLDDSGLTAVTTSNVTRTATGTPALQAGFPLAKLKAVAGQNYLTAVSDQTGSQDVAIALQLDNSFGQLSAPGSGPGTLTQANTGGTIPGNVTVFLKYEWVGAGGVTTASPETNIAVNAGTNTNTVSGVLGTAPTGATGAKIFASTASGQETFAMSVPAVAGQAPVFTLTQVPSTFNPTVDTVNTSGTQLVECFFNGLTFLGLNLNPALT